MRRATVLTVLGLAALALGSGACRPARVLRAKLRRGHHTAPAARGSSRAPGPPTRPAFASQAPEGALRAGEPLVRGVMYGPFFAAVDGSAAVLNPAGRLRWVSAGPRGGAPVVREVQTPCRFDASRHSVAWPLSSRVALDGRGNACCVHDGDAGAHAGAWCASLLEARPSFRRARTLVAPTGVGSGEGAVALFASTVWCTRDGGRTVANEFRGDAEQVTTAASCAEDGSGVMVAGTRSLGAEREQTLRYARAGGAMEPVAGAPRGEALDLHATTRAAVAVLVTMQGYVLVRAGDAGVATAPAPASRAARVGFWGPDTLLLGAGPSVSSMDLRSPDLHVRRRQIPEGARPMPTFAVATRVGETLVGLTREGEPHVLTAD